MRIAYIHSLPRSGSTFLETMLSANSDAVALGEIERVIRIHSLNDGQDPIYQAIDQLGMQNSQLAAFTCKCGKAKEDCSFWGDLLPSIKNHDIQSAHTKVLDKAESSFPGKLIIDNSKTRDAFDQLYCPTKVSKGNELKNDVRVVVLVRDFRGWVRSIEKQKKVAEKTSRGMRRMIKGYLAYCYLWYMSNKRLLSKVETLGVPYCVLSYESLVFQFDQTFPLLAEFLGLKYDQIPPSDEHLESHELYGSPSMKIRGRQLNIRYDGSWISDSRSVLYSPLLIPVYRLNSHIHKNYGVEALKQQVERYRENKDSKSNHVSTSVENAA